MLNINKSSSTDFVYYAGLKMSINASTFINKTLGWAGVFIYKSSFLSDIQLIYKYGVDTTVNIPVSATFEKVSSYNYETNDDDIINKLTTKFNSYNIKLAGNSLFKLLIKGSLSSVNNFILNINPAKAYFYEA